MRVPEIAVEGEDVDVVAEDRVRVQEYEVEALVLNTLGDDEVLRESHLRGTPVIVRAADPEAITAALEHPEVACALVPAERADLRELDLRQMKYG